MIPVRIELRNFMSYGEGVTPLDFTGMHLACLSGDNGHGKSALLDAITWALWGEARASADELIRLGADEMRVIFDFQLGDDLYRVIRSRGKRASANLWEIYIADDSHSPTPPLSHSPEWRPLTGQGIRDTGRVIQRILRMDYRTFVNSACIQQGRADEFTKQTVSDRKRILADILDLSRYDALEQRAKERRNEADLLAQDLEREIARIAEEVAHQDAYRDELKKCRGERESVEAEIAKTETRLRELQTRHAELESQARRAKELEDSIQGWRAEIAGLGAQKSDQERRVARNREVLKDKDRILEGSEKLRVARELLASLDQKLQELRRLEHERGLLEQHIAAEKHKLELGRDSLSKEVAEIESRIAGAERVEKDVASLREQVKQLDELDARRVKLQETVAAESEKLTELKGRYERMLQVKEDLESKVKMLGESAQCPLCRTELDREKHDSILAQYASDIERVSAEIADLKKSGSAVREARDSAQREIAAIEQQSRDGLAIRGRLAQAEQLIAQMEEHHKTLPDIRARLADVTTKLGLGEFAQGIRTKIDEAVSAISKLEYDPDVHEQTRRQISELGEFDSLFIALQHAEEHLPQDEASLKAIRDLIASRERSVSDAEKAVATLRESANDLSAAATEMSSVGASLQTLRASDREVTGRIATLESALARCESLRAEVSGKTKDLEKAKQDRAAYSDLVAAFGKKGVQALIIENAVPEIQDETNRLLARMTDNAMQVSIETVRDKKTGGTAETLDIRISDDMGTRSYDLFSGGEAFRINFALRIALSKLLARRAGARLQTLIIDEGFGTQDGKGREKLVEAINSIRDDFEKILVITHIDELKDAFPTRIEITKDSSGSQIAVN